MIKNKLIVLIEQPAEEIDFNFRVNEVWLFNVLQHVINPSKIIYNCKRISKRIYFFEPINCGLSDCHLWDFNLEYFKDHFGNCVQHYKGNKEAKNFHTHECAFGIWKK